MDKDAEIASATKEAHRAKVMSWLWWAQVPLVTCVYWFVSTEPTIEKLILVYLADVSIVANAVTYASKSKALEAKKAGYEHPTS